jgi:hypothetical protein
VVCGNYFLWIYFFYIVDEGWEDLLVLDEENINVVAIKLIFLGKGKILKFPVTFFS